jgi:hypothetical protein
MNAANAGLSASQSMPQIRWKVRRLGRVLAVAWQILTVTVRVLLRATRGLAP